MAIIFIIFGFPQSLCLGEEVQTPRKRILGGGENIGAIRMGL
jgi:hypothetical protein